MSESAAATDRESTGTPWSRYLKIGLPLLAVALAVIVIWLPKWKVQIAINGLHATDGRTRAQHIENLKNHPDKELVIKELLDSVQDEGHSFAVRRMCCDLLVDHFNRLAKLSPLIRDGALHTRGAILTALMHRDYFESEYVEDPRYRVRETLVEWLRERGDVTRVHAIQLAVKTQMKEVMPEIRTMLRRSGLPNVHDHEERDVMIAAGGAVERFADCESVPVLLEVAEEDADYLVRLRYMQQIERVVFRQSPESPCPGSVDEERMKALVQRALGDSDHRLRMGAMLLLADHPAWAQGVADRVQAILDGEGSAAERRQALEALVAMATPEFLERFPTYFHDPAVEVRRSAARSVSVLEGQGFEGCWIGLLAYETPEGGVPVERDARHALWRDVLDFLFRRAGARKGFPAALNARAGGNRMQYAVDLATLFSTGELAVTASDGTVERITRGSVSEAWFRWWCVELGLEAERSEKAVAAWRAFHAAKTSGRIAEARAALDALGFDAPGLFTYERAWLARQG